MSQAPNLTREQAGERSATITTSSYDIAIDLTDGAGGPGEKTFGTTRSSSLSTPSPGSSTFIDFVGDGIATATLNGRALDVGTWTTTGGLRAGRPGRDQRADRSTRSASTPTPARVCTGSSTRSTARSTCTRSSRPPTRSGCTPASTSRTSRRGSPCTVTAPGRLAGGVQRRDDVHRARSGRRDGAPVRHHRADEHLRHRPGRRARTTSSATTTTASTWASSAGPRWPSTSTPSGCSPRPSRASTSSTAPSVSATRSASTTSSSCRSSTPARWRTPAR